MGSTRLPGKVLMDLAGQPVLTRVIERVRAIRGIDQIAVATTTSPSDAPVVRLAEQAGVLCIAGSEQDVLDRYHQAALACGADTVMRITADCPLLDPEVSCAVLARFLQGDVDYASNIQPPTFPDGLDTEVFSMTSLHTAWRDAGQPAEREHVTPFIRSHPTVFRLANVAAPRDLSYLRWTVDEPRDLAFVRQVYARLPGDASGLAYQSVLDVLADDPSLGALNAGIARNAGAGQAALWQEAS